MKLTVKDVMQSKKPVSKDKDDKKQPKGSLVKWIAQRKSDK